MTEEKKLPEAIYEGEIKIGNIILHTAVLDDGMRVINAEDLEKFWMAMGDGSLQLTDENSREIAKFIQGKP